MIVNVLVDGGNTVEIVQTAPPAVVEVITAGPRGLPGTVEDTGLQPTSTSFVNTYPISGYSAAFTNYTVRDGVNVRVGRIDVSWNDTLTTYTENSSTDLGNTSAISFSASLSGGNIVISAVASSGTWQVRTSTFLI